jgi:hypothetical protein
MPQIIECQTSKCEALSLYTSTAKNLNIKNYCVYWKKVNIDKVRRMKILCSLPEGLICCCHLFVFIWFVYLLVVVGFEFRASHLLGKHSTAWATITALWKFNIVKVGILSKCNCRLNANTINNPALFQSAFFHLEVIGKLVLIYMWNYRRSITDKLS